MLIQIHSDKTVKEAAAALHLAVAAHHFGVMHVHDLKDTLWKKGEALDHECLVFEVCQPQQARKVLEENMSLSTALPCRISVFEEGGRTVIATIKPTVLLSMVNTPQLNSVAQEVEDTIVKIMTETAAG
ncbi:MAG: DUF302 domain-containing protein [Verrucomicrobiales bacterium]|nr:DUF302 domain-containing protein [Verrucomicrobiales bacterium]MCP5558446.1 DUF302 domain-containing protein [Verrucomicrobiaceae bacterium]